MITVLWLERAVHVHIGNLPVFGELVVAEPKGVDAQHASGGTSSAPDLVLLAPPADYDTTVRVLGAGRQNYACKNSVWLRDRLPLDRAKAKANEEYNKWERLQSEESRGNPRGGQQEEGGQPEDWVLVKPEGERAAAVCAIPPRAVTELILSMPVKSGGRRATILLEGLITNFFVVCCESRGGSHGASQFVVQTADRGVLPGQMRGIVLSAVQAMRQQGEWAGRVRASLEAPAVSHIDRWDAAFLTSE
jgi:hypothetical protein